MMNTVIAINEADRRAYHQTWSSWGRPNVTQEIHATVSEPQYRPFVAKTLSKVPERFIPAMLQSYCERGGGKEANEWLRESVADAFSGCGLSLTASDDDICRAADNKSEIMRQLIAMQTTTTPEKLLEWISICCRRYGVEPPQCKTLMGAVDRVCDAAWWRRTLRRHLMRRREHGAIKLGFVHRKAGLYVSNDAMHRHRQSRKKSRQWMELMEAINEEGEVFDLVELAEGNVSNPDKRRAEMMVRVKGQEEVARTLGYEALFVTWTTPSRMHATADSRPNPKYDDASPKEAHGYLCQQWGKARAALDRADVPYFGLRVAEPHHDGTPHWHLLLFVSTSQKGKLLSTLIRYALEHDADEPGAKKHRFTWELIDPDKGSAVAYVAKYVSKNIDGKGVGADFEAIGEDTATTAERVTAWANLWRIRQFQFFGDCPVTIYRELRRLREAPKLEDLIQHWLAADDGNWSGYLTAMLAAPIKLWTEEAPSQRYQGETIRVIRGVEINGHRLETRQHTWTLRRKSESSVPWTRVNNCTRAGFDADKIQPLPVFLPGKRPLVDPGECTSNPAQSKLSNKSLAGRVAA